jgi:PLP dependent protein
LQKWLQLLVNLAAPHSKATHPGAPLLSTAHCSLATLVFDTPNVKILMKRSIETSHIAENLLEIHQAMATAAAKSGRQPEAVTLCVVSKTFPVEMIQAAYQAGSRVFGENRVQELQEKTDHLPADISWHLIGHLQSNKARKAIQAAHHIHSVDSLPLAIHLSRIAAEAGRVMPIFLQVNIAQDQAKHGWATQPLCAAMEQLLALPGIAIHGLMTIPELAATPDQARPHFAALREFRDQLTAKFHHPLPHLSMGMSGDFQAAIQEGSTLVRIGSRVFGKRI